MSSERIRIVLEPRITEAVSGEYSFSACWSRNRINACQPCAFLTGASHRTPFDYRSRTSRVFVMSNRNNLHAAYKHLARTVRKRAENAPLPSSTPLQLGALQKGAMEKRHNTDNHNGALPCLPLCYEHARAREQHSTRTARLNGEDFARLHTGWNALASRTAKDAYAILISRLAVATEVAERHRKAMAQRGTTQFCGHLLPDGMRAIGTYKGAVHVGSISPTLATAPPAFLVRQQMTPRCCILTSIAFSAFLSWTTPTVALAMRMRKMTAGSTSAVPSDSFSSTRARMKEIMALARRMSTS